MKKLLAAALLCTVFASPAFAAKKPKQHHQKYDYRYHAPKFKVHKSHNHQTHQASVPKSQSH